MKNLADEIRKYPSLKQFLKFCIVGVSSAVVSFVILFIFTQWVGVWYLYSSIIAYILSAIFNFITNKLWTFRNKERGRAVINQAIKFSLVISVGLTANTSIIYALTEIQGFDYRISWVFATGVVAVWNYSFNRFWTFRHAKPEIDLSVE